MHVVFGYRGLRADRYGPLTHVDAEADSVDDREGDKPAVGDNGPHLAHALNDNVLTLYASTAITARCIIQRN